MSHVLTGADQLLELERKYLQGKRLGLLTNPTGILPTFRSTVDVCASLSTAKLTALFACEHGIRGDKPAGLLFEDEVDPDLGIPVYSLYGKHRKPTESMLQQIDALLFDIQDLGIRFYTYLTTLVYVMEACAEYGKEVIVLDRPNPLGGYRVEGGLLQEGFESMVGGWKIPFSTGLTIGEFARLVQSQMSKPCELQVIPMKHWSRDMQFRATGLPWVMPSPNIPTMDSALVYAGTCLFEGTNLSEGRGTTKPFEIIGAPWLQGRALAAEMNQLALPGVVFNPWTYQPTASKHEGKFCQGIQLFITNREQFHAVNTGLHLLHHVIRMHEEHFEWLMPASAEAIPFIDLLSGSKLVRENIHTQQGLERIIAQWTEESRAWRQDREPFLMY